MRLSCLPVSLYGEFTAGRMSLEDWFQLAAQLHLDGADISVAHLDSLTPPYLKQLRAAALASGVEIAMLVTYSDFALPDATGRSANMARVKQQIEAAAYLGAPLIRLTAGQAWPGVSFQEGLNWVVEGLWEAASHARAHDVQAVYENHVRGSVWPWNDFTQAAVRFLAVAEATRGSDLGLLFDTANNLALFDDPVAVLAVVLDRVTAVHLADIRVAGAFQPVVMGTGVSPHAELMAMLVQDGFDDWVSVEEASQTGRSGLAQGIRHADAVWYTAGGRRRSHVQRVD